MKPSTSEQIRRLPLGFAFKQTHDGRGNRILLEMAYESSPDW
jgi:hypothetical protein